MGLTRLDRCVAVLLLSAALFVTPNPAAAQKHTGHRSTELGVVDFQVSCSMSVRADFDRAVALLHHMTYPQARESFERILDRDPACAMAHWGIAMSLFQPLWPTRPDPAELRRGWQEVQKAMALDPPTERERSLVAAVEGFFREPETADYWTRIRRFERGMERAFHESPNDRETAAFYALAHLATAQLEGGTDNQSRAAKILHDIHRDEPRHPGAVHYTIHANDVVGREGESLDIVRSYEEIAPENPHALHMPTHIFVRLGSWHDVIRLNRRAADAALRHPAGDFVWDEYPHTVEYLVYAYLQRGEDELARTTLARLQAMSDLQPSFKTAFHLTSIPARFAVERRAWTEAASLTPRPSPSIAWDHYPWAESVTWLARALGAARGGDRSSAGRAVERLTELRAAAEAQGEAYFATQIEIARLEAAAWQALAEGLKDDAERLMRGAVGLEGSTEKHAVTPGALVPAYELLGDLLLELGRPTEALTAYENSLQTAPRRFNGLLGAARAARQAGSLLKAEEHYRTLLEVAEPSSRRAELAEARAFLARGGRSSNPGSRL